MSLSNFLSGFGSSLASFLAYKINVEDPDGPVVLSREDARRLLDEVR